MKTEAFTLRMTPKLRAVIKSRAQAAQISESAWVSLAIYSAALPSDGRRPTEIWAELAAAMSAELAKESAND